jgi:hypothetical protein
MSTLQVTTEARHANLDEVVTMLREQQDVKYDVVVPAERLSYQDGLLAVDGGAVRWDDDGATEVPALLRPTSIFEGGVADKLGIPVVYLRRMREAEKLGLLDHNVNDWLGDDPAKNFFVRGFRTDDADEVGIARAFLSDTYRPIDNLDILMAVLGGIREAGLSDVKVYDGNISERSMSMRVTAPEVNVIADELLKHYRSPFDGLGFDDDGRRPGALGNQLGARGHEFHPHTVFAGFRIGNSETGGGRFVIVPQAHILICSNGMSRSAESVAKIHLGGKMDAGRIEFSTDTQRKNLDLIVAQTRDAVQTFLSPEFLADFVAEVTEKAGKRVSDAPGTIQRVGKALGFSEAEQKSILDCFISSGDLTAGGVMNAATAAAQMVAAPHRQAEIEDLALDVLEAV